MITFGFDKMYTFIYHKDLDKADRFYGSLLGLEMEPESDWVHLFKVVPNVIIGAVQDGKGYLRAADDKPVILCLRVPSDGDIREVYNRLKENGVRMQTDLTFREIEGWIFFCQDPEGYVIEIVQNPRPNEIVKSLQ